MGFQAHAIRGGREFHRAGQAPKVEVYDFVNENGRASPYGVYDLSANDGFVIRPTH